MINRRKFLQTSAVIPLVGLVSAVKAITTPAQHKLYGLKDGGLLKSLWKF